MKKTFLMCPPRYYGVDYEINPWMSGKIGTVDRSLASKQWSNLYKCISQFANIKLIDPEPNLPDMVFTANAGAFIDGKFVVSNFKHEEREGEEKHFLEWASNKYDTATTEHHFEGAGDLLYSGVDNVNFLGHSKRTSKFVIDDIIGDATIVPIELVTDDFYHLDTCFCPLDGGVLLMHRKALHVESWAYLDFLYEGKIINVSKHDAALFACNAVCIGNELILPAGISQELRNVLNLYGYNTHEVELSEFIKSGGAAKCLTLEIY